jgi:hypothetical protein
MAIISTSRTQAALAAIANIAGDGLEDSQAAIAATEQVWTHAVGAATAACSAAARQIVFRAPYACTLLDVTASLAVASTVGLPTFDILKNGTTMLSTGLTIDVSELTSVTAATPKVISVTSIAADDEITVTCSTVGTSAVGLKLNFKVRRTAT